MSSLRLARLAPLLFLGACVFPPSRQGFERRAADDFCAFTDGIAACFTGDEPARGGCHDDHTADLVAAASEDCRYDVLAAWDCIVGLDEQVAQLDCSDPNTFIPDIPDTCDDVYVGEDCVFDVDAFLSELWSD